MATVRIYKVAELLGTTSQEVTALLKREMNSLPVNIPVEIEAIIEVTD